ncbi:uncharacterized protein LOC133185509 [Saccostrea echinata]|uniref:uncharacterized protein LOC133185509 n=1 Tax=Saccostrea echinata TaxID=191078 RepID=UPI002A81FA42|nr:uncharacterized protein LOC133185509 [Saccostrea echinata]
MDRAKRFLERKGYSVTTHPKDENSFYYSLHLILNAGKGTPSGKTAKQMRDELFKFEVDNALYFHLFHPQCVCCDGTKHPKDCLTGDLERVKTEKKYASSREIYAGAELLQKNICLIRYNRSCSEDMLGFQGYIFAPSIRQCLDSEPVYILMIENQDRSVEFGNLDLKDNNKDLESCPWDLVNEEHKNCFGLRFRNSFCLLFDESVRYGIKDDVKDLYRRLSLEFYGNEDYHERILNIICNFELEEDNLDLFCKYVDDAVNEETSVAEKERLLKSQTEKAKNRQKPPGDGELYAISSVFNVDIVVDKMCRGDWETYMSVACTYACCFKSPILLRLQTSHGEYMPYVTAPGECSCRQKKPEIQGHIGKIKDDIHNAVLRNPCCPPSRKHQNHTHLKHVPNYRTFWPQRTDYLIPTDDIQMVTVRLYAEERRLDQINGGNGTLAKALSKELYGDENQYFSSGLQDALGNETLDFDEKMRRISDWLTVPIYIYRSDLTQLNCSQGFFWTKFEPTRSRPDQLDGKKECRFYITLFYNGLNDSYDRITPLRGCNCEIPPPLSLLRNQQKTESQLLFCVDPKQRHHPLTTFLSKDPDEEMFMTEIRDFPVCTPYSSLRIAMQRNDMEGRTFDSIQFFQHSLLRCLSKEIFGTEQHVDLLLKELCEELLPNILFYEPVIGDETKHAFEATFGKLPQGVKDHEKLAKFVIGRIEDDLPTDELLLWLACTFFQTDIYVLRVKDTKTSTESSWTEFSKLRTRKRNPKKTTRFTSRCPRNKTPYISLIQTESKQFHRIVPKMACCNCVVDIPDKSSNEADSTPYPTQQDCKLMRRIRIVDTLLETACVNVEQWLLCNQILQRRCDLVICEIEGRRKNVNIATISGSGAGIVGAVLTGVGIALAPVTGGISTLLAVGGGVLAVSGGTVAAGAKITETYLNSGTIDTLKRYQNCYQERFERVQNVMEQLKKEVNKLAEVSTEIRTNQNIEASDFAGVQSLPGILRTVKGLAMIPISLLKVSARGIIILGAVIGPLTALFDAGLLAFSAYNMAKGNRTDLTENLRRISASLHGARRQMHNWAYGNVRPFYYD